jgi:lipopolysaccharide export system permease protein
LHERFSSVLYPIAFVLMAIAVVGQAQSTRQNRHLRMGLCFLAGVGIRLAGLAVNNIVTLNPAAVPVLYLIPLVATGISMHLIVRGARPSKPSPLVEKILTWAQGLGEQVKQRFTRARLALPAGSRG